MTNITKKITKINKPCNSNNSSNNISQKNFNKKKYFNKKKFSNKKKNFNKKKYFNKKQNKTKSAKLAKSVDTKSVDTKSAKSVDTKSAKSDDTLSAKSDDTLSAKQVSTKSNKKIKNKGTGAGGKNTNKNGLKFEEIILNTKSIKQLKRDLNFKVYEKHEIYNLFLYNGEKTKYKMIIDRFGKKKIPDFVIINQQKKFVYIIECKNQNCSGSVDEKIETGPIKLDYFKGLFNLYDKEYTVSYNYILSSWFNKDKYKWVFNILNKYKIKIFIYDNIKNFNKNISNYFYRKNKKRNKTKN